VARRNADIMLADWCANELYDDNGTFERMAVLSGALRSGVSSCVSLGECRDLIEKAGNERLMSRWCQPDGADALGLFCAELMLSFFESDESGRARVVRAASNLLEVSSTPLLLAKEVIDGQT